MKQHHYQKNQPVPLSRDMVVNGQERQQAMDTMQLSELNTNPLPSQSSVILKLTDECSAAIQQAAKKKLKIYFQYYKDICTLEIGTETGDTKRFDCMFQSLGYPIEAIMYDDKLKTYQTISTLSFRFQIRATEKTFAETREKAQKMVEEQQKRKAKDMNSRVHKRIQDVRTSSNPSATLAKRVSASSHVTSQKSKQMINIKPSNVLAPNISGLRSSTASSIRSTTDNAKSKVNKTGQKYESQSYRSYNANCHTSNSQKSSPSFVSTTNNSNSINSQVINESGYGLTTMAAAAASNSTSTSAVTTFRKRQYPLTQQHQQNLQNQSEKNSNWTNERISPSVLNTMSEKRRTTSSNNNVSGSNNNSNFVSTENLLPIQPTETTPSLTPSSITSSIDSPNSNFGSGKLSFSQYHLQNQQEKTSGGTQTISAASSTNWRHNSLSPDENINFHRQINNTKSDDYRFRQGYESLTLPTKPTHDWSQVFGEIQNIDDAKKYHKIFSKEYPEYCECYKVLSKVANEFTDLELKLKKLPANTFDHNNMEERIQLKFAKYQNDEDFLLKRQKHTDLRAKLEILKQRIIDWENAKRAATGNEPNHHVSWSQQSKSNTSAYTEQSEGSKGPLCVSNSNFSANKASNQRNESNNDLKSNYKRSNLLADKNSSNASFANIIGM